MGDVVFQRTVNAIMVPTKRPLKYSHRAAHEGIRRVRLLPGFLTGEARECAVRFAREMKAFASTTPEGTPALLIAGGETTVTVSGKGIGGRNQELALACASEIDGESGLFVLAAGSDGVDGVSDAPVRTQITPHAPEEWRWIFVCGAIWKETIPTPTSPPSEISFTPGQPAPTWPTWLWVWCFAERPTYCKERR